jgi:hypothetical protein
MAISLAAGAAPIFMGPPAVTGDSDRQSQIIATSMQSLVHRIYQLDPLSYWVGSLGEDDTQTEVITMGLYIGSFLAAQPLDSFILLNNNLDSFKLEYCTDYVPGVGGAAGTGTWQTVAGGDVAGNAGADWRLFLAVPIANVNGLRLNLKTTSPAAKNKKLGNFIAALTTFQASKPASKLTPIPTQTSKEVSLGDKTTDYTYMCWSDSSFVLTPWEMLFDYIAEADKANFDNLLITDPFLCYIKPGDVAQSVMLARVKPGTYKPDYMSQMIGMGYKIPFQLQPLGYL